MTVLGRGVVPAPSSEQPDIDRPSYDDLRDAFDAVVTALKLQSCHCTHPAYGLCSRCAAVAEARPVLARAWGLVDG